MNKNKYFVTVELGDTDGYCHSIRVYKDTLSFYKKGNGPSKCFFSVYGISEQDKKELLMSMQKGINILSQIASEQGNQGYKLNYEHDIKIKDPSKRYANNANRPNLITISFTLSDVQLFVRNKSQGEDELVAGDIVKGGYTSGFDALKDLHKDMKEAFEILDKIE